METKYLEDLIALAETRSFQRAAKIRWVTQNTLSRRIKTLEQWAGANLIDRSAHPPSLTKAGEVLRWKAVDALHCLKSAQIGISQLQEDNQHG